MNSATYWGLFYPFLLCWKLQKVSRASINYFVDAYCETLVKRDSFDGTTFIKPSKALFFPFEMGAGEDGRSLENFKNMLVECGRIDKWTAVWLIERGTGGMMNVYIKTLMISPSVLLCAAYVCIHFTAMGTSTIFYSTCAHGPYTNV